MNSLMQAGNNESLVKKGKSIEDIELKISLAVKKLWNIE
jgi:hypothetical protein